MRTTAAAAAAVVGLALATTEADVTAREVVDAARGAGPVAGLDVVAAAAAGHLDLEAVALEVRAVHGLDGVFSVPLILKLHKCKPSRLARDPGLSDGAELLEGLLDVLVVDAAFLADLGASLRTRTVSRLHQRGAEAGLAGSCRRTT